MDVDALHDEYADVMEDRIVALLAHHRDEITAPDLKLAAFMLMHAAHGLIHAVVRQTQEIVAMMTAYLAGPAGSGESDREARRIEMLGRDVTLAASDSSCSPRNQHMTLTMTARLAAGLEFDTKVVTDAVTTAYSRSSSEGSAREERIRPGRYSQRALIRARQVAWRRPARRGQPSAASTLSRGSATQ
jgi:hypothetical protein